MTRFRLLGQPVFIVLDGIDGSGKSTQCRLLAERLRRGGREVVECADPGGTPLGAKLRALLLESREDMTAAAEALLFMASRAELVARVIRPALERGALVVSDRFLLSNVVYQGHAGGLDAGQLWQAGRLSTGGLEPDLYVVLDLPADAAALRRGRPADRVESRGADYLGRVRDGFLTEARRLGRLARVVDAGPPAAEVASAVRAAVAAALGLSA